MEISSFIFNATFFLMLVTWVLVVMLKRRRVSHDDNHSMHGAILKKVIIFTATSVGLNFTITVSYLCFCSYEYLRHKIVSPEPVFSCLTWILATVVTVYSKKRIPREQKSWPLVLNLWWIFATIFNSAAVFVSLITHAKDYPTKFQNFLPKPNAIDISSIPFTIFLCSTTLVLNSTTKVDETTQPLLQNSEEFVSVDDGDPYCNSGIWSKIIFLWLNPLFKKGRAQKLELHHIPSIPQSETAAKASSLLEEKLREQKTEDYSVLKAIVQASWRPLALNAMFAGVNTLASYMGPYLITNFVNYLSGDHDILSYHHGLILAFIFLFSKSMESLSQRQWCFGAQRIGIRVRAALTALAYKKSISINYARPSNGKIVNLINVDIERIGDFFLQVHGIWLLPVQVLLALIILYLNLGLYPSISAVLATIFVMLSNTPLAKRQERLHSKIMDARDSRIKTTSETLKIMRVLKLHSWEMTFMNKILQLRESEKSWLRRYLYTCSTVAFLFWTSPTLVSIITFGVCILLGTPLTAGTVLSALATFKILQEPIYNLPELISMIAQTKVSMDRIQEFVREEPQRNLATSHPSNESNVVIETGIGDYSWEGSDTISQKFTLKIMENLKIRTGCKVGICGSVGSGKSSFLCGILGEVPRISGVGIKVYGSKAYVPQSAWIQTGTVRENVLFGKEMDKDFYDAVLEACALNRDIGMWKDGDLSLIGERGLNLSGGQKQRIQIARAIYSNADVYFLDDPFSAVDAHTGAHIFQKCLKGLLAKKTVIYVTHQLEFLDAADLVLVMKEGQIVQSGKYDDLMSDPESELVRQVEAHTKSLNHVSTPQEGLSSSTGALQIVQNDIMEEKSKDTNGNKVSGKANEEETASGRVKWQVYSTFIHAAYKGALVPIVLLCHILFQGLQIGSNYWLAWATEEEGRVTAKQLIGIFALLSGVSSFFVLGRAVLLSAIAIETSHRLFVGMIRSVFRAPLSFFDSTPSSRILSRSSTDQSVVDTDIPYRVAGLAFALVQLFSIIFLMSLVAWPIFLLFLVILILSVWYQEYYINTARELARMVGTRKAPVVHHFSESIAGAATIRCFNQEMRFSMKCLNLVDEYSRVAFHNCATMEWLSVRINFLFNFVFFIVLVILVTMPSSAIGPSLAGLVATYGLSLNVLQAWVIWNMCNVENKMISVERILQFTNIPSEAPLLIKDSRPAPKWPEHGCIELENLHVQYKPSLPMVLKGITCTFPGEKKIGVVGRTGSGKSTIIQSLFRVVEPSLGRIIIDGVDITKIGLEDLRSRLSIIPQDPTLFQGTMRANVDPLQQHSDQEIWEVLCKCGLAEAVSQDRRLLDAPVAEDGENWSVGQRQLVCLARVLLQRRRILVLDEATASVDTATDNVIQRTIREETSHCTVMTVAHRIPTVIDNDLVLVLDDGKIVEYDAPSQLLNDTSSAFSKLVNEFLRRSSKPVLATEVRCDRLHEENDLD
ncbi:ABC transporter-like, ATP-binding domain [Dillenia turbinata]|uniref:ABC-type xenobiotic transporter n=1 Tax=Dillenia turbinata TaxID=194707 RepID=A0AAN8V2C8_9MAGN